MAMGLLLTVLTIHLVPMVADLLGWRYAFLLLAPGPVIGAAAMAALRTLDPHHPEKEKQSDCPLDAQVPRLSVRSRSCLAPWVTTTSRCSRSSAATATLCTTTKPPPGLPDSARSWFRAVSPARFSMPLLPRNYQVLERCFCMVDIESLIVPHRFSTSTHKLALTIG
jgi:hypothetical protein